MSAAERALAQRGGTNSSSGERHITNHVSAAVPRGIAFALPPLATDEGSLLSEFSPPSLLPSVPHRGSEPSHSFARHVLCYTRRGPRSSKIGTALARRHRVSAHEVAALGRLVFVAAANSQ